jgi:hypothetical protein
MNTPTLNPCEECKGTGETIIENHDCDCPDCLGTGLEQPQKRIIQLECELAEAKQKEAMLSNTIKNDRYVGRQEGLQMERELTEARDQLVGASKLMNACDALVRNLTEARKQRDTLAEALDLSLFILIALINDNESAYDLVVITTNKNTGEENKMSVRKALEKSIAALAAVKGESK